MCEFNDDHEYRRPSEGTIYTRRPPLNQQPSPLVDRLEAVLLSAIPAGDIPWLYLTSCQQCAHTESAVILVCMLVKNELARQSKLNCNRVHWGFHDTCILWCMLRSLAIQHAAARKRPRVNQPMRTQKLKMRGRAIQRALISCVTCTAGEGRLHNRLEISICMSLLIVSLHPPCRQKC